MLSSWICDSTTTSTTTSALVILILILKTEISLERVFTPCELGSILLDQNIEFERLGDWICLAHAASGYNSSLIGGHNTNPNKNLQYGIFQVSNYYYCYDEFKKKNNDCKLNCTELADDKLEDDIKCAKLIYERGKKTFSHWSQMFDPNCKKSVNGNQKFYEDCDFVKGVKPEIISNVFNVTLIGGEITPGQEIFQCVAEGTLPININWLKNRKPLSDTDTNLNVSTSIDESKNRTVSHISIRHITFTLNEYVTLLNCEAVNKYGRTDQEFLLKIIDKSNNSTLSPDLNSDNGSKTWELGIAILVTTIIISLVGFTVYKYFLHEKIELNYKEIQAFLNGDVDRVLISGTGSEGCIHKSVLSGPYNKDFEINRRDLQLDMKDLLGSGQFGMVYKGTYKETPVAVKTLKPGADKMYLKALLSEVKVMIYIKGHPNVTHIVGAYTKELRKGLLLVLLEYSPLGSLMKYLQTYRQQKKSNNINPEVTTGLEVDENSHESLPFTITAESMFGWSYQISNAMEYLSSKKVIHGDLATRNVLLLNINTIKITDFGLSRKLYNYATYVKGDDENEPLPWRWLAPETLRDLTFSSNSDVWSYGITIWEIFTYAQIPYPGLSWSVDFLRDLERGLRLKKPDIATNSVFKIMQDCWKLNSHERPTFTLIRQRMYLEIKKFSKVDYIELDHQDSIQAAYRSIDFVH